MSETTTPRPSVSPDDALPPVQPPSAGFIIQLFVVPGIIVLIIVSVWLMFNWLAHMGSDPQSYIRELQRNSQSRWHAAASLADALRVEKHDALKDDSQAAADLAGILDREITAGRYDDEQAVSLRYFLCKALGEFRVPEPLPVLLRAAETERDPRESKVRESALESIAVLIGNLRKAGRSFDVAPVEKTLLEVSRNDEAVLRLRGAFALGVLGGDAAIARLRSLAEDVAPDVRFNAATGLARHGDAAAVDTLLEMLAPVQTAGVEVEERVEARGYKQAMIHANALEASLQLAQQNPSVDVSRLTAAIQTLIDSKPPQSISLDARKKLAQIESLRKTT